MHYKDTELPLTATRYKTNHFSFLNFSNSPPKQVFKAQLSGFY